MSQPVVAVISCWKNAERIDTIRKTWKTLSPFPVKFILGSVGTGNYLLHDPYDDLICLPAPDDYLGLPQKIRDMACRLRGAGFDYVLKVDDDTFVAADRLLVPAQEYVGKVVRNGNDKPWYCHGGAGYWLGPNALGAVSQADPKGFLSEDAFVASSVTNAGIGLTNSSKHNVEVGPDRWKKLPRQSNDFSVTGEFDCWELRRAFDLYKKDDREERMTADEFKQKISGHV